MIIILMMRLFGKTYYTCNITMCPMHVNIEDVPGVEVSPGVTERILLHPEQTDSGMLKVTHHVLTGGEVLFKEQGVEYQHYIIAGCAEMGGSLLHSETGIFVPGVSRFGAPHVHGFKHAGESELRILTSIFKIPRANFRWAKTRVRNLAEREASVGGMQAQQLFTEEEHALMGSLRMHSVDVQTHAPGVELGVHRNPEEFGYFLRGTGEAFSGDGWDKVRPGSLVYTAEGVPHAIKNTCKVHPLQYVAYEFTNQDESWTEMGVP